MALVVVVILSYISKNKIIEGILNEHKVDLETTELGELEKHLASEELELKLKKEQLRELKYQLILGKTLVLDSRKHLEDTTISLPEYGVSVEWSVKESEVKV